MGSKTISLDDDAYDKLSEAKRPGESFSDVVHRVFGSGRPTLAGFADLLDKRSAEAVAEGVAEMRRRDVDLERARLKRDR